MKSTKKEKVKSSELSIFFVVPVPEQVEQLVEPKLVLFGNLATFQCCFGQSAFLLLELGSVTVSLRSPFELENETHTSKILSSTVSGTMSL